MSLSYVDSDKPCILGNFQICIHTLTLLDTEFELDF